MIRFLEKLKEVGCTDLLEPVTYNYKGFTNDDKLFAELDKIMINKPKVLIHGDSDPDGVFSAIQVMETFNVLGFRNYEIWRYKKRSHNLTNDAVNYAIYNKFKYMIILDSSSKDLLNINKLINFGVTPIILDHHQCPYEYDSYPDGCIIINTIIENRIRKSDFYKLSAGALTFCLMYKYLLDRGIDFKSLSAYALITLYSDSIDMSGEVNRGIYYMATSLPKSELPKYIKHYMQDYQIFSRRFIEYTFVPKINALFRAERLDILNKYLFDNLEFTELKITLDLINSIHEETRKMVNIATDEITRENLDNIVIANLGSTSIAIHNNNLHNYTGLVANNLSQEYGKPCVVLCDTGTDIKGSFRDFMSRNYLRVFQQFSNADGHGAAFGIKISYRDYEDFMYYIKEKLDKKFFIYGVKEPMELEIDDLSPNHQLLEAMALYNEFSGIENPMALLVKKNNLTCTSSRALTGKYLYKWGPYTVSSSSMILKGAKMKIKPVKNKNIKLETYNRNVML